MPALDAILFLHPRKSQIDVVQSVGRVMRRAEGKRMGTPDGRAAIAILLMQDLAVVPILFGVDLLGVVAVGRKASGERFTATLYDILP